jgi:hypothetical protein
MKALSIRQPWAWAILHAGKDIENRTWYTNFRGVILIHAGKKVDKEGIEFIEYQTGILLSKEMLITGGIIGSVEIVDCVTSSKSKWFLGKHGFALRNPISLPFIQYKGQLGFFETGIKIENIPENPV